MIQDHIETNKLRGSTLFEDIVPRLIPLTQDYGHPSKEICQLPDALSHIHFQEGFQPMTLPLWQNSCDTLSVQRFLLIIMITYSLCINHPFVKIYV